MQQHQAISDNLKFSFIDAAVAFWFFFATEKELSPRGYERNEIINTWCHQALENLFLPVAKRLCESLFSTAPRGNLYQESQSSLSC